MISHQQLWSGRHHPICLSPPHMIVYITIIIASVILSKLQTKGEKAHNFPPTSFSTAGVNDASSPLVSQHSRHHYYWTLDFTHLHFTALLGKT